MPPKEVPSVVAVKEFIRTRSGAEWQSDVAYPLNVAIFRHGVPFRSKTAANLNHDPELDTFQTNWEPVGGGQGGTVGKYIADVGFVLTQVAAITSSGHVILADKSDGNKVEVVGFCTLAGTSGNLLTFQTVGKVSGFTGLTPGLPVYLGNSGAVIQSTSLLSVGEYRVYLGLATSATEIYASVGEAVQIFDTTVAYSGLGEQVVWPNSAGTPPANLAPADGRAIDRVQYSSLFNLFGTVFGSGDGSTTFNLPNWSDMNQVDSVTGALVTVTCVRVYPLTTLIASQVVGGGVQSYVRNGDFESGLSGWSLYKDAAGVSPVDGIGGVSSLSLTLNKVSPHFGTQDALLSKGPTSYQGEGLSYDVLIDPAVVGSFFEFSFWVKTSGSYVAGDVGVFLYDITNANLISLSDKDIQISLTPSKFSCRGSFSNSLRYRVIFHVQTVNSLAYTLELDAVSLSLFNPTTFSAVGPDTSYTPTLGAGYGSVTELIAFYQRVGQRCKIYGEFRLGTAGAGTGEIGLPPGLSIDTSKFNAGLFSVRGQIWRITTAGGGNTAVTRFGIDPATPTLIWPSSSSGADLAGATFQKSGVSSWAATNDRVSFEFEVPIAQWSVSINLVSDSTEYAYNTSNSTSTDTTSFGNGQEGVLLQSFAPTSVNSVNKRVRFRRKIQSTDLLIFELYDPVAKVWYQATDAYFQQNDAGTLSYGHNIIPINDTDVDVHFYSAFAKSAGSTWALLSGIGYRWRVRKISNGNMAEQPATVRAFYTTPDATSPGNAINFSTKVEDTHNSVQTGSGSPTSWKFTAPIPGIYLIESNAYSSAVAVNYRIILNGSVSYFIGASPISAGIACKTGMSLRLKAGDFIAISNASSTNVADANTWIQITRLGS